MNSIAALAGNPAVFQNVPSALPVWVLVAIAGGLIGSELGTRRVATATFRRLLAMVLIVAGVKLAAT